MYQTFWRRLGAWLIDRLLASGLAVLLVAAIGVGVSSRAVLWLVVDAVLIELLFRALLVRRLGQTVGKLVTGIMITGLDGAPLSYGRSLLREALAMGFAVITSVMMALRLGDLATVRIPDLAQASQWYDGVISLIWLLSNLMVVLANYRGRAIHDLLAGTQVILAPSSSAEPRPVTSFTFAAGATSPAPDFGEPPPLVPPPEPFVFHGRVGEYFGIWIVNTLLILLTGGLYFAWARVRKRRYLRGSTELMGHRFDYRANPTRLLIGTLMVAVLFLAYSLFGAVYPTVRFGAIVVAVILLPWIVVRSLCFNAHNTVYRGMRFRFNPSIGAAAMVYLVEPLLILISLGLYYPAWTRSKRRYLVSNHRLGDAYFRFTNDRVMPFFRAHLMGGAIVFGAIFAAGIYSATLVASTGRPPGQAALIPAIVLYGLGVFLSQQFVHARLFNHVWNHTQLDGHRFVARMKTSRWLGLQLTNLGAIIGTAGLLYPWAVIRAHRYTASCITLQPSGPVEEIGRLGSATVGGAAGDTAAEFLGLDFGL